MYLVYGGFAFAMGLISGYPVGAKIVSDFREKGLITKDEGERLLCFTNNSGPLFILSTVGIALFGDTKTGLLLLLTHILACITVGIILGRISKKDKKNKYPELNYLKKNELYSKQETINMKNFGEILASSINSSISTLFMIGGFVVIFSVIISILNVTNILDKLSTLLYPLLNLFNIDFEFAKSLLSGILELTNGVNEIASIHTKLISQNIVLCAFLLGFGGFSVLLQVYSIISKTDLSIKSYLKGKFLQGILASIYTFLLLKFIPFLSLDIVQANATSTNSLVTTSYSFFYSFGIFVIAVFAICLIFRIFNRLYLRIKDF